MRSLRAGVIGVGHLGRFPAEKCAGCNGVELVGVVRERRTRFSAARAP